MGRYAQIHCNLDAFRQYDASVFKNFAMPGESVLSVPRGVLQPSEYEQLQCSGRHDQFIVVLRGYLNLLSRHVDIQFCSEVQLLTTKGPSQCASLRLLLYVPPRCMRRHRVQSRIPFQFRKSIWPRRKVRTRRSTAGLATMSQTTRR